MTDRRCAFLTMDKTDGWAIDADLGIPPLQALGWSVDTIKWRRPVADWRQWDAVYIGTPWDYPENPGRFLAVLEAIEDAGAVLVNPLSLVRWSLAKTYLRDLDARGAPIVPSLWYDTLDASMLNGFFDACGSERIIVKPAVSSNATDTFLLGRSPDEDLRQLLLRTFTNRPYVVQPFIASIQTEGEYSLFYLGGAYSHAIQKTPKARDFRVQEEHGARIEAIDAHAELIAAADKVLACVTPTPVYARCDLVRGDDNHLLVMELEIIEPSLYLRTDADAPARFAHAFDDYVTGQAGRRETAAC